MILVEFRCAARGCGRLLDTIAEPLPAEITALPRSAVAYVVKPCPRHGGTVEGFVRLARPGRTVSLIFGPLRVPPTVLWTLLDDARRTGLTQVHTLV